MDSVVPLAWGSTVSIDVTRMSVARLVYWLEPALSAIHLLPTFLTSAEVRPDDLGQAAGVARDVAVGRGHNDRHRVLPVEMDSVPLFLPRSATTLSLSVAVVDFESTSRWTAPCLAMAALAAARSELVVGAAAAWAPVVATPTRAPVRSAVATAGATSAAPTPARLDGQGWKGSVVT